MSVEDVIIKFDDAFVSFKNFAMKPVNLEIPKGYIIGIQGKNGAGKTTLLKMMLGVYERMRGKITIDGLDVVKERENMLSKVGLIMEEREFFEEEDAVKNEEYFSVFYENWDKEKYRKMLKKMGLSAGQKLGRFSKGERVMYQLAFMAAYQPEVILLDEPTAGLDTVFRQDFLRILQDFVADYEATILMSTHIEEDLNGVADYIIEVDNGNYVFNDNI